MDHSPEPWTIEDDYSIFATGVIDPGEREFMIAEVFCCTQNVQPPEHKANLQRIAACVNACQGISTETLNRFGAQPSPHLLDGWQPKFER